MQINRNEDGKEGRARHFGGQGNFVWLNHDRFAGGDRNSGGDGRGSFKFHGSGFFGGSSGLFGGSSGLGSGGLMGVSAAKMDFCTVRLERFPK